MKREKTIWFEHQKPELWASEYPECSMYAYVEKTALKYPDYYALFFEGKRTTYSKLIEKIDICADSLLSFGVKKNDLVTIISPNIPQAVYTVYAVNKIGAVANIVHPLLSENEIKDIVQRAESNIVFIPEQFCSKVKGIALQDGTKPLVVLYQINDELSFPKDVLYKVTSKIPKEPTEKNRIYWKTFIGYASGKTIKDSGAKADDLAIVVYTGGTTGRQKGVMLTNLNFNSLAIQSYDTMGIDDVSGMKVLAILPIFHGTGMGVCIHSMLCNAFQVFLVPQYKPDACNRLIFKEKINFIFGVPAFYEALVRSREIEKYSCAFLKVLGSCGDVLPDKTRKKMNAYLKKSGANATITNGYGMSECTAGCCYEPFFLKKEGSSGMMVPDMHYKIVDPGSLRELPDGEVGELCISGPTVMKGYFRNDELTRKVLKVHEDGKLWLHSGDAFFADKDGYLYYKMRLDRMFIVSGYNIYPQEMESVINSIPGVFQCCIVGKNADVTGKRIVAFIIPEANANNNDLEKEILSVCKMNFAEYSIPQEIIFVAEFPKTRYGKVDYKKLEVE